MFRRRKGIGYIPGPRPRLPDEDDRGMLGALVWVLVILVVVAVAVMFGKYR